MGATGGMRGAMGGAMGRATATDRPIGVGIGEERDPPEEQKKTIEVEKANLDKTVAEYCTVSESILNDYTQAMDELRGTKGERDQLQQLYTKCNRELNKQIERSRLLKDQRKEVQDQLGRMDEQVRRLLETIG